MSRDQVEQVSGALAERQTADGRRRIKLNREERAALVRQRDAERAAALLLDIDNSPTYASVSEEMGITIDVLKKIVKTKEFDTAYNALLPEVGHDPRYRAVQGAIADMLPTAARKLGDLLTDPNTPPSVRLRAIQSVFDLNQLEAPQQRQYDREGLVRLLQTNVNVENMNVVLPTEYAEAVQRYLTEPQGDDDHTIEAEARDLDEEPPSEE